MVIDILVTVLVVNMRIKVKIEASNRCGFLWQRTINIIGKIEFDIYKTRTPDYWASSFCYDSPSSQRLILSRSKSNTLGDSLLKGMLLVRIKL